MKQFFTSTSKKVLIRTIYSVATSIIFLLSGTISAQTVISNESFPNSFNPDFTTGINTTFAGSSGTWAAFGSNTNATVVCSNGAIQSSPWALKLVNYNNSSSTSVSTSRATSPTINLSNVGCISKVDLVFWLNTHGGISSSNHCATFYVDYSSDNGSTWTTVWQKTAAQLFTAYGANTWNEIYLAIPSNYFNANFKYRFRQASNAGCATDTYLYIDDARVMSWPCANPCTATVSSLYFNKLDGGTDITITNGATFTTDQLGSLYNLEAGITGTAGSVKFTITGPVSSSNIENTIPYNSPGTGSGAWTGTPGNYSVNIKVYSNADGTGTLCDEETISFILNDNNCNCPGNIVRNPSFENGTTDWNFSGGNFSTGTGAVQCGAKSGDMENTSAASKVWQNIGTNLAVGTTITASVYAGTHDNTFNNWVAIEFLNGSGVVLGSSVYVQVDKVIANSPVGPQLYNINATVPTGAVTTRVAFGGNGSWTKTDQWCVTSTPPPPTGSIGDRVWLDADGDGIQDASETGGITGVTVQLRNSAGTVIATTTTNGSGNYIFTGLAAGTYTVVFPTSISGATLSPVNVGSDDNVDSDPSTSTGITANIVLGAGQNITNVDAGYCPTTLVLGNFVWNDINNNGVQDGGEPGVNLVTVRLYKDDNGDNVPDGAAIASTTTNSSGNYSFGSLVPGNYIVGIVIPAGYSAGATTGTSASPNNDNNTDNNGVTTAGGERRSNFITLTGGGEPTTDGDGDDGNLTLDFGIRALGSIGDRVWNDTDRDGIQDAGELGLAGVTVSLFDNSGALIASTVTDAYGNYKFANLPVTEAGLNYQVRFSLAPGYVFSPQNADAAGISGANNSDANVTTGRTGNVTLTTATPNVAYVDAGMYLRQPNKIGDFIWNDLDKDGVQDAGEPGIAGVVVTLYDNAGNPVRTTITDNNGHYEFNDVPNGTYTLGITPPPGYQASSQDAAADGVDSDFNPATFRTAPFVFNGGVNLTFDGGLNVTPSTKASVGDFVWADLDNDNVQDANEPGIPGVTVQLFNSANVLIATTTTNALGYYVFNNVDSGNYYVKFSNTPAGYNFVTADAGSDDTKDSDVTGANGSGTTATFSVAADTNNMTIDAGLRATTALNSLGDYVWYDLDKDGIQDAGEAGVPGVTVTLYNATTGAVLKTTTTNAQGLYMFTDVAAGSYTVGFSNIPAGHAFSPADAGGDAVDSDPNPNTGRTGTITVVGTGNVITTVDAGIVSNPNTFDTKASIGDFVWNDLNNNGIQDPGEPGIPGVTVTLYAADGTTVLGTTTTDALGNYQFTNLNAGTYIVGFSGFPAGYSLSTLPNAGADDSKDSDADPVTGRTGPVTLLPGQINTTVDAALRNPTVLARLGNYVWNDVNGNGHQETGEPGVPGVSVYLLNSAGTVIKNTLTDANGLYMFTDMAAGTYRIAFGNLPAGFVATTKDAAPANDNTDSDADATTLTTDAITLAAGAADMTWDFGVRSTTTASVGDYVWSDVDGDGVQDANESGIAGVLVTLYNSAGVAVASTVTDANGKYLFVNVAPGSYTMGFSNLPIGSSFTTKDNGADAADSDVNPATGRTDAFSLVAGQSNMTIDAGLVTRYAAVGNYVWQDLNRNGIQDAGEPPVAGVTVILYNSANQPVASAVTDGNGYYFINNIPASPAGSNYTIGFTDTPSDMVFTSKNASGSTTENDSNADVVTGITDVFTLSAGQIRTDIDAGLIRLLTIRGNVWHDINAMTDGFVNNSGAAAIPPAAPIPPVLRAYLVNLATGLVEQVAFVNPADGTFSFSQVSPNTTYYVVVSNSFSNVGNPPPAVATLPTGWIHTGQKNDNPPALPGGNDGLNDGRLIVPVGNNDVININFGIKINGGDVVIG